ncbi:hypothetical protein BJ875DRAFT_540233 [Amylocarpus encephaloides]|uniref:Uncharacterized protein n=1 Tax=Amylocarpus encephaloides TaxID=45428 RepID=A0A9P7YQD2_9HELO|nr:hypothetical protein BJ875DRAFT_540233 [Amylocarpus encephaloides]
MGVIGHEPQVQRHTGKLKGRVFAPRYRLAPQFPFPRAVPHTVWQTRVLLHTTIDFERFPDCKLPPSALAGQRVIGQPVDPEKPRGGIRKGIIARRYGTFDQDSPLEPTRPGETLKQDRRRTAMYLVGLICRMMKGAAEAERRRTQILAYDESEMRGGVEMERDMRPVLSCSTEMYSTVSRFSVG